MKICTCVIILSCALLTSSAPINITQAVEYLIEYGYLGTQFMMDNTSISDIIKEESLTKSIMKFQEFIGLEQTGKLDKRTQKVMQGIRCGVPDKYDFQEDNIRKKRFAINFSEPIWDTEELTYRIYKYSDGLSCTAVDEVIQQAFDMWSDVTNLIFRPVLESADINIAFLFSEHGDDKPFKGNTYGHALGPPTGIIHFDANQSWAIRNISGEDILQIAVHEIGHALGLMHSTIRESVMYPLQKGVYNPKFQLHDVDILRIQFLYGPKKNRPPDLCQNATFDAILEYPAGVIYVFKEKYYWKLIPDGIASGYPRIAAYRWPGLPSDVDAATATKSGLTYFFKGNKYWTYQDITPCDSNPSYISIGWPGIPDNVDAVMWGGLNKFYFFKGNMYWLYDSSHYHYHSILSYPKPITKWGGIQGGVDAALYITAGYIYFFSNGSYYRYNCRTRMVDYGHPKYPRPVDSWWFHCDANELGSSEPTSTSIGTSTFTVIDESTTTMVEDTTTLKKDISTTEEKETTISEKETDTTEENTSEPLEEVSTTLEEESTTVSQKDKTTEEDAMTTLEQDLTTLKEETTVLEENTTPVEDETTVSEDSTPSEEDTMEASEDVTTSLDDTTTESEEGTVTVEKDTATSENDKATSEEDITTMEEDTTIIINDTTTIKDEDTTVQEEETTVQEEDTTVQEEYTTVQEEDTTVQEEYTTEQEEDTTVQEEDTTVQEEDTTVQEEDTTEVEEYTTESEEETTITADEETITTEEITTTVPEDTTEIYVDPAGMELIDDDFFISDGDMMEPEMQNWASGINCILPSSMLTGFVGVGLSIWDYYVNKNLCL